VSRVIVHLDADAFFASVEQAADSRLRGKPIAVGGEKRGIIASASYEARKFGVYTPMPTVRARKLCPKLIVVPGDFDKYEHFSRWMFSYLRPGFHPGRGDRVHRRRVLRLERRSQAAS
jgi:DNA polymerase-4